MISNEFVIYFDNFRTNGNQTRGIIEDLCRYCGSKQHWHTDPPRFEQLPPTHRPIYKRKKSIKSVTEVRLGLDFYTL